MFYLDLNLGSLPSFASRVCCVPPSGAERWNGMEGRGGRGKGTESEGEKKEKKGMKKNR